MIEYRDECHNDSFPLIKYTGDDGFVRVYYTERRIISIDTVYNHKPPTFEGFMEFILRKNKERQESKQNPAPPFNQIIIPYKQRELDSIYWNGEMHYFYKNNVYL
jgi:hypothetical protein